jgi:RimJ/RimL family protein N-acetyltransferase
MSKNPLTLAPVVSNTSPARLPGPEPLTGKHVNLERLAQTHFSDLYENIGSHAELWIWWPDEPASTASEFDNYLNEFLGFSKDLALYAVLPLSGPDKGRAVGLAFALSEDRTTNRVAELGLFYGPQLQRTRAGTEAAYLVAGLMFELNHRRLGWKTNSLNLQSRKAAERYGFVCEGTHRQDQINKGRSRDTVWYSIIDSEWPVCRKAFDMWLEDENFDEQQQQRRTVEEIRASLGRDNLLSKEPEN